MSRKIYYEGEVVVLVPVQVKVALTVRAEEDADLENALEQFSQGCCHDDADLEAASVEFIVDVNGFDTDDLEAAVQETLDGCGWKNVIKPFEVVDSK